MSPLNKQRMKLLALILLFAVPMVSAWVMVEFRIGIPDERTAHGELNPDVPRLASWPLVEPRPPIEHGDWVLAFDCEGGCEAEADQWWRLHRALGREAPRVTRLRLGPADEALPGEVLGEWQEPPAWRDSGQLWLLDPQGQPVLGYSAGVDPQDVLADLSHLLRMNNDQATPLSDS
ncbi:hypothetical protein BWR19_09510 [Halomonas sp. 1513]|nr:hypothetical protein [Halomonas sp. 1513]APX93148.1 hypothetical protein BWR19_09510 [Halomonas sp. 1513]